MLGSSSVATQLAAPQEGLSSVKLVSYIAYVLLTSPDLLSSSTCCRLMRRRRRDDSQKYETVKRLLYVLVCNRLLHVSI
jgi:hypothetical protein